MNFLSAMHYEHVSIYIYREREREREIMPERPFVRPSVCLSVRLCPLLPKKTRRREND
jgi:hypothetical protein